MRREREIRVTIMKVKTGNCGLKVKKIKSVRTMFKNHIFCSYYWMANDWRNFVEIWLKEGQTVVLVAPSNSWCGASFEKTRNLNTSIISVGVWKNFLSLWWYSASSEIEKRKNVLNMLAATSSLFCYSLLGLNAKIRFVKFLYMLDSDTFEVSKWRKHSMFNFFFQYYFFILNKYEKKMEST